MDKEKSVNLYEILLQLNDDYPKTLTAILEILDITDKAFEDTLKQLEKEAFAS